MDSYKILFVLRVLTNDDDYMLDCIIMELCGKWACKKICKWSYVTIEKISKITKVFCYDCRYNRDIEFVNTTRVFSWYDIYKEIKHMY